MHIYIFIYLSIYLYFKLCIYIYIYSIYKSASIKTPVGSPFQFPKDLSLKLRVAKTGVAEPRAAPKRQDKRRSKDRRQRRATGERTSRNGATGAVAEMKGCWGYGYL